MSLVRFVPLPPCPKCGKLDRVYEDGERNWFCTACKWSFDDDPDEGGDYSNDPTRRIELAEARKASKRNGR